MIKTVLSLTLMSLLFIGCGGSSKSKKKIDILDYLPSEEMSKNYLQTSKNKSGENHRITYTEVISIEGQTTSIKIDDTLNRRFTTHNESITKEEYGERNNTIQMERFISVGSVLYTVENSTHNEEIKIGDTVIGTKSVESKKVCKLNKELDTLTKDSIPYKDDILEFKCTKEDSIDTKIDEEWEGKLTEYKSGSIDADYDISYFYLKKGVGLIVDINNDCFTTKNGVKIINDDAKKCSTEIYTHKFFLD